MVTGNVAEKSPRVVHCAILCEPNNTVDWGAVEHRVSAAERRSSSSLLQVRLSITQRDFW